MAKLSIRKIHDKNPVGWSREFEDPIDLPRGRQLVTLEDAGNYITRLPKAEHSAPEWQAAMQALMLVARGGPTMFAWIGVMRAQHRNVERCSIPIERTRIGESGSWRGIDDDDRKVLRRHRSSRHVFKPRPIISAIS
jgi:hypothetical protein